MINASPQNSRAGHGPGWPCRSSALSPSRYLYLIIKALSLLPVRFFLPLFLIEITVIATTLVKNGSWKLVEEYRFVSEKPRWSLDQISSSPRDRTCRAWPHISLFSLQARPPSPPSKRTGHASTPSSGVRRWYVAVARRSILSLEIRPS